MKQVASVIQGKGRGKTIGFPTINLQIPKKFDMPFGIYGGYVWLKENPPSHGFGEAKKFRGAFHYGAIPTFNTLKPSLEVFVLDAILPNIPSHISFELLCYVREIKKFSSARELSKAIKKDVTNIKKLLLPPPSPDRAR